MRKKTKPRTTSAPSDEQIVQILNEADDDLTLQEIGTHFDITRMRVCQIEKNGIHKLRALQWLQEIL